jgi:hypothetical protein
LTTALPAALQWACRPVVPLLSPLLQLLAACRRRFLRNRRLVEPQPRSQEQHHHPLHQPRLRPHGKRTTTSMIPLDTAHLARPAIVLLHPNLRHHRREKMTCTPHHLQEHSRLLLVLHPKIGLSHPRRRIAKRHQPPASRRLHFATSHRLPSERHPGNPWMLIEDPRGGPPISVGCL